jgi:hypothetical protein
LYGDIDILVAQILQIATTSLLGIPLIQQREELPVDLLLSTLHAPSAFKPKHGGILDNMCRPGAREDIVLSQPDEASHYMRPNVTGTASFKTDKSQALRDKKDFGAIGQPRSPPLSLLDQLMALQSELDSFGMDTALDSKATDDADMNQGLESPHSGEMTTVQSLDASTIRAASFPADLTLVSDCVCEERSSRTEQGNEMDRSSSLPDHIRTSFRHLHDMEQELTEWASGSSSSNISSGSQTRHSTRGGDEDLITRYSAASMISQDLALTCKLPQSTSPASPHCLLKEVCTDAVSRVLPDPSKEMGKGGSGLQYQSTLRVTESEHDFSKAWGETPNIKQMAPKLWFNRLALGRDCGAPSMAAQEKHERTSRCSPSLSTRKMLDNLLTPSRGISNSTRIFCTTSSTSQWQIPLQPRIMGGAYIKNRQPHLFERSVACSVESAQQSAALPNWMDTPLQTHRTDCTMLHNAASMTLRYLMPNSTLSCSTEVLFKGLENYS